MARLASAARALALLGPLLFATGCTTKHPPPCPAESPASAQPPMDPQTDTKLRAAVAAPTRTPADTARDKYRHPVETLEFFGIRDNSTVVELWPGQGWYTAILAPLLAEKGKLVVTSFDPNGPPDDHNTQNAKE